MDVEPWYRFDIYPIAPCLRPADENACVSSDMCTPIWPNQSHPQGRTPPHTEPEFPFDNCYFWFDTSMKIRVCPRAEGFNWKETTALWPISEYDLWRGYEEEDRLHQIRAQKSREPQPQPALESCAGTQLVSEPSPSPICQQPPVRIEDSAGTPSTPANTDAATLQGRELLPEPITDSRCPLWPVPQNHPIPFSQSPRIVNDSSRAPHVDDDTISTNSRTDSDYSESMITSTDGTDIARSDDSFTMLTRLFADPKEGFELQPLCHIWYDLAANIKQEEIPNPIHLFEERDAVVR